MDVYLIRHTKVGIETGICYGHTDVPLAETFPEEAARVREKLPVSDIATVYASPLRRCRLLAERLTSDQIEYDPRLMELNFGDWEQQRWDAIGAGKLKVWTEDFVNQPCPGGESYRDLFRRTKRFWQEFSACRYDCALIVTHGGVIRALLAFLLDIPLAKSLRLGLDFGGVTKIHLLDDVSMIDYINR